MCVKFMVQHSMLDHIGFELCWSDTNSVRSRWVGHVGWSESTLEAAQVGISVGDSMPMNLGF